MTRPEQEAAIQAEMDWTLEKLASVEPDQATLMGLLLCWLVGNVKAQGMGRDSLRLAFETRLAIEFEPDKHTPDRALGLYLRAMEAKGRVS